jgi:hypothetical protein
LKHLIGVDQLDLAFGDVSDPALELLGPRAVPLGIARFLLVEAVV